MNNALELLVRRPLRPIGGTDVSTLESESAALRATVRESGLQDKALAVEIGVDNATFSRVQSGQARLSEDQVNRLMDATGSETWLAYWIAKRGYDPGSLRRIETDVERENRELRERIRALEHEHEIEMRGVLRAQGLR